MKLLSKEHRVQTKELINIILAGREKKYCYVGRHLHKWGSVN